MKKRNEDTEYIFKALSRCSLRGDPFLLKELKAAYEYKQIETVLEFEKFLFSTFRKVTGGEPQSTRIIL